MFDRNRFINLCQHMHLDVEYGLYAEALDKAKEALSMINRLGLYKGKSWLESDNEMFANYQAAETIERLLTVMKTRRD